MTVKMIQIVIAMGNAFKEVPPQYQGEKVIISKESIIIFNQHLSEFLECQSNVTASQVSMGSIVSLYQKFQINLVQYPPTTLLI